MYDGVLTAASPMDMESMICPAVRAWVVEHPQGVVHFQSGQTGRAEFRHWHRAAGHVVMTHVGFRSARSRAVSGLADTVSAGLLRQWLR